MTKWEKWVLENGPRKEIICSVFDYDATGRCNEECILYPACTERLTEEAFREKCDALLDEEYVELPDVQETIANLTAHKIDAEKEQDAGLVRTLTNAIALLREQVKPHE